MTDLFCSVVDGPDDAPCGKPARRVIFGSTTDGCCDECFALIQLSFETLEQAEREYPLAEPSYVHWLQERVTVRSEVLGGEPVFVGSRLGICAVAARLRAGDDAQNILRDYPYLTLFDLECALRYCR